MFGLRESKCCEVVGAHSRNLIAPGVEINNEIDRTSGFH